MKPLFTIIAIATLLFTLSNCGFGVTAKSAEPTANKFYELIKNEELHKMEALLDESAGSKDEWMSVLEAQKSALGKLLKYDKKVGFHTSINNGVTSVELNYECEYENGITDETLWLKQVKKGFKITGYEYKARQ